MYARCRGLQLHLHRLSLSAKDFEGNEFLFSPFSIVSIVTQTVRGIVLACKLFLEMESGLCSLIIFLTFLIATAAKSAGKVAPKFSTDPKFHHRAYQQSIVLGKYLYIDGGEITTWNGEGNGIPIDNPQDDGDIWTVASKFNHPDTDELAECEALHGLT